MQSYSTETAAWQRLSAAFTGRELELFRKTCALPLLFRCRMRLDERFITWVPKGSTKAQFQLKIEEYHRDQLNVALIGQRGESLGRTKPLSIR